MTDTERDDLLTLTEACKRIRAFRGRRIHPSTLWRWCRKGVGGTRLSYLRLGRRICVTEAALHEFFAALASADRIIEPAATPMPSPDLHRTPAQRQAAIEDAERRLTEAGI